MATLTHVSNPVERARIDVATVTGAKTLTAADSGIVQVLSAAAGAQIDLPALEAGLHFRFIVGDNFATTDWTVVSSTNVIQGNVDVNNSHVNGSDENTITFVASAESVGDFVDVVCDGTNWYVSGAANSTGAVTLTQE